MLGVDECRHTAQFLRFGNHLQRQRGFPRRFRPEDFHDAAAWNAAHAERIIDADRAGWNGINRLDGPFLSEPHDGALAELFLDLPDRELHGSETLTVLPIVAFELVNL